MVPLVAFALQVPLLVAPPDVEVEVVVGPGHPAAGVTLIAPLLGTETVLFDLAGRPVHRWQHTHTPGLACRLLEDGSLLRCARGGRSHVFGGSGGEGGRLERWDWSGELVWLFELDDEQRLLHHDAVPLPNGNVLAIAWERRTEEEVFEAGRRAAGLHAEGLWPDVLCEVRPNAARGGEVVWEWRAWDHLVQDARPGRPAFGAPADALGAIDVNFDLHPWARAAEPSGADAVSLAGLGYVGAPATAPGPDGSRGPEGSHGREGTPRTGPVSRDWLHTNSVDYDPVHDLILLSVRATGEIWVLDHSTTTAEARGVSGGRQGRGGAILWRWGNPLASSRGGERQLFGQHDARWLGNGRVLVFDNGLGRPHPTRSRVLEVQVPIDADGLVSRAPSAPDAPLWVFDGGETEGFYASHLSGAQRLSNGNTLITRGTDGIVFEVTPEGQVPWRMRATAARGAAGAQGRALNGAVGLFRALRYPLDCPGLARLAAE
ncbi:MAG: aryl-sulfate sulfotransferase [Planctomycetota bacterium]